jgi:rare lipoprotein A
MRSHDPRRLTLGARVAAPLLLGVGVLWGCTAASMAPAAVESTRPTAPPRAEVGLASWYGEFHHGLPTASGEPFDMTRLTAAHRSLPLGTRLQVTNLENGRIVEVRVNDRGPYVAGRVLDLSHGAARVLDMVERGVVPVRIDVVSP